MSTIRLSAIARTAVRRALTNHEGWTSAFRNKHGYSLANMSSDTLQEAATHLGIDVRSIANVADSNPRSAIAATVFEDGPAPINIETAEAMNARHRLEADQEMKDRAREERRAAAARAEAEGNDETRRVLQPVDGADKFSRLARMLAELTATTVDEDTVRAIVQIEVEKAIVASVPTVRIELRQDGVDVGTVDGHKHPEFAKLLRASTARDAKGYCPNVWIAGPAGSGKTHAVSQVAAALDVPFHFNGAIGMAHELLGFIDGRGNYHRTAFREAYENGGCYLFDEVDGSDNAALLALNAALANGTATFPDAVITRHKDCRIFAAANTWGFGGTSDYVGRTKLDAAFLSRFPVRLTWNYDDALERAISGNADFADRVQRARARAKSAGVKMLITPRDTIAGAALIAAGFTHDMAAEMTYLASLSDDVRRMIGE